MDVTVSTSLVEQVYNAVRGGQWMVVAAMAVVGLVWLLRNWPGLVSKVPFLSTDRGGVLVTLATSLLLPLATAVLAGKVIGWSDVEAAGMLALTAIGGYTGLKRLLWPKE